VDTDGFFICRLIKEAASSGDIEAHAHLIAAAPDLFMAVQVARMLFHDLMTVDPDHKHLLEVGEEAMLAAIDKATK